MRNSSIHVTSRSWAKWWQGALLVLALAGSVHAQPQPLSQLGLKLEKNAVTVSGISSGAYMASQFGVAYSASVAGVGMVAGGPYGCSLGSMRQAMQSCSCPWPDNPLSVCYSQGQGVYLSWSDSALKRYKSDLDPLENIKRQRIMIYRGETDRVVNENLTRAAQKFYLSNGVPESQVTYVYKPTAGHAFVSPDASDNCRVTRYPYMVKCDDYDLAGLVLQWLYPPLQAPQLERGVADKGSLKPFNQSAYTQGMGFHGLDDTGWIYVPKACERQGAQCRLHVAFHGCEQSQSFRHENEAFGKRFVENAGYNEWAETANIVVLYPQTKPTPEVESILRFYAGTSFKVNPKSCWDFWGYTDEQKPPKKLGEKQKPMNFATRSAPQMKAIKAMIDDLVAH